MAGSTNLPAHKYGMAVGMAFHARLADVWAARRVTELPIWSLHADAPNRFLIALGDGYELLFESNHENDREASPEKSVNWALVTRVKLLEVTFNG